MRLDIQRVYTSLLRALAPVPLAPQPEKPRAYTFRTASIGDSFSLGGNMGSLSAVGPLGASALPTLPAFGEVHDSADGSVDVTAPGSGSNTSDSALHVSADALLSAAAALGLDLPLPPPHSPPAASGTPSAPATVHATFAAGSATPTAPSAGGAASLPAFDAPPAAPDASSSASLSPSTSSSSSQLAAIVPFLTRNLSRIETAQAIQLLPSDASLASVAPLLAAAARTQQDTLHTMKTAAHLASAHRQQAASKLVAAQRPYVIVDHTVKCFACGKRAAGAGGVLDDYVVTTDKRILHARCSGSALGSS